MNEQYLPLLTVPWTIYNGTNIVGQWAEDNSEYTIECPVQLAPILVAIQNALYNSMKQIEKHRVAIQNLEKSLSGLQ